MSPANDVPINPAFADCFIASASNPYRSCIQGLANEPITVRALLARAAQFLETESRFAGLGDYSLTRIVERLASNRPRIAIIHGSLDHPAHLFDYEHVLRAAARVWQNGGVPFAFGIPVICDGTAQSNIGQCYSLASRNHTAMTVNINMEGHSYHAAYVLAGCDKTPTGILSGLAAADRARRHPERASAPLWAMFVPSHVLKGGSIPARTREKLRAIQTAARQRGDAQLAEDIEENCHYILQCASDEAFLGLLNRAKEQELLTQAQADAILNELAAATCDEGGGICAFNGSGNSSRTLLAALGFVPAAAELLLKAASTDLVAETVDQLFRCLNRPEYAVCHLLEKNYANAVRIHNATGSSSNLMLHMPCVMRHAGFDVSLFDYERIREATPVPDIFAHSLTEGRDTFVLAQQAQAGLHYGMTSLFRVLKDLGVPMDWDAPTISGQTWGERVAAIPNAVSPDLAQERSIIRIQPVRDISGTDILRGNFFSSCTLKVAGMSSAMYHRFDARVFVVRYYENEADCNEELRASDLAGQLAALPALTPSLLGAIARANGGQAMDARSMIEAGTLAFAFVIAGQGPAAFGMPEMFAPSQSLRHHGVIEKSSLLMTDGRYSGVTKGACIGHIVPEAYTGGGVGALESGDLLWVRLSEKRIDLLDTSAFLAGCHELAALPPLLQARQALIDARRARMEARQLQIAACSVMEHVSDAESGVVPLAVHRRATIPWP